MSLKNSYTYIFAMGSVILSQKTNISNLTNYKIVKSPIERSINETKGIGIQRVRKEN